MANNESQSLLGKGAEQKLSVWRKLAFGCGEWPSAVSGTVLGFFITPFLLEVANVRPSHVTIILLLGRVWDAITDPLVGFLTTRFKTRIGRLRPWIGASIFPSAIFTTISPWLIAATNESFCPNGG